MAHIGVGYHSLASLSPGVIWSPSSDHREITSKLCKAQCRPCLQRKLLGLSLRFICFTADRYKFVSGTDSYILTIELITYISFHRASKSIIISALLPKHLDSN